MTELPSVGPNDTWGQQLNDAITSRGAVYLLDHGEEPDPGSAEGVVFWKAPEPTVWDFTLGSLPSGWSARATPTSQSFDGTGMQATYDAGDAYRVDMPAELVGQDCVIEAKFLTGSGSGVMLGVMAVVNSTGNGVGSVYYSSPSGLLAARAAGWTYGSSFDEEAVSVAYPAWMRLRVDATGTNFNNYASRSLDGLAYSNETAPIISGTPTTAPDTIAIGSLLGTVTSRVAWVKASGGVGGLQGWFDGSQIVAF